MQKHTEPIRATGSGICGVLEQAGLVGRIHGVVDQEVRSQKQSGNQWQVCGPHSDGCRVDEQVGIRELLAKG